MNTNPKQRMMECFSNALKFNMQFIAVVIKLPNGQEELIINRREGFMDKMNYYDKVYDDELFKRDCKDIQILAYTSGNSLFAIEGDLYE